ncbi:MAG: phosphoenolpyruvate synthase [Bacteroidales bacterium]|nr:phosphoenolpyruvate synthase [Bacteroidales bacterium]
MKLDNIFSEDPMQHNFTDTMFSNLMRNRIYHVLLIASTYDAFMLEDDGRIDEQIFMEYVSLNLRYPPQFFIVNSEEEALQVLETESIDLIINMLALEAATSFEFAKLIKIEYPDKPIVALAPFSREVSIRFEKYGTEHYDYVFAWLGNADILVAIIKLIEDKMNAEYDISEVGVQAIILVEDSVRFYSAYLPNIYKIIMRQSMRFMQDGLNDHQKMMRMRGRAKILLATTYEEAITFYEKYRHNLHGIISDMSYPHNGIMEKYAGLALARRIKADNKYMPFLIQSSDASNGLFAKEIRVGFIHKNSKTLSRELRKFIVNYFAFGEFIFVDPKTHMEVERASDLKSLQRKTFVIPDDSLSYHLKRNHLSKWLNSRAIFPLASLFQKVEMSDFDNLDAVRRFIFESIAAYRTKKGRGVIAQFNRENFDEYLTFTRIGAGSLGGKARGLAFLDSLITRNKLNNKYPDAQIRIPKTLVLTTEIFDEFMDDNDLYKIGLSDKSDEDILEHFLAARIPFRIQEDLLTFIKIVKNPVAVRSSSLLEDSHYQPFAGIYSTYMIPCSNGSDEQSKITVMSNAIKAVYASVFYKASKAYMSATSNVIDEEKMAIVVQEAVGRKYGDRFYPSMSGVGRSINFYPIEPERAEDGIVNIALGLGKYIVDGGMNLRFSPSHPKKILQLSSPELALRESQKYFYALDLTKETFIPSTDDSGNLVKVRLKQAEEDGTLKQISSSYDFQNNMVRDGSFAQGKKIITFANVLKYDVFPLAKMLSDILETGEREMSKPVEIEFAVELDNQKGSPGTFYILQIRPIVENQEDIDEDLSIIPAEKTLITSNSALGNGQIKNIQDIIYVKPDSFDAAKTDQIAEMVGMLNDQMIEENKNYVLIGPGRWGSSDPWLGIPVKWPQISMARLIVESGLENYRIDPSQGTHFFQNLTSFRVGYFTINPFINDGHYDLEFLSKEKAVFENEFIRHIRCSEPLSIKIDGKQNTGVVMLPKKNYT